MKIKLKKYDKKDFKKIKTIIRKAWHYDDFCSLKTSDKLSSVYLSSCLTNYTFSCVAMYKDEPLGIILVKDIQKHKCPLNLRLNQIKDIIALILSKEGRSVSKIFENVDKIDKILLNRTQNNYDAELALFAISPEHQGKGIGKILFNNAIDYMKNQNIKNFYLFTDTSCNYKFYEHFGLTRKAEQKNLFNMKNQTKTMTFFIYDFDLSKI